MQTKVENHEMVEDTNILVLGLVYISIGLDTFVYRHGNHTEVEVLQPQKSCKQQCKPKYFLYDNALEIRQILSYELVRTDPDSVPHLTLILLSTGGISTGAVLCDGGLPGAGGVAGDDHVIDKSCRARRPPALHTLCCVSVMY